MGSIFENQDPVELFLWGFEEGYISFLRADLEFLWVSVGGVLGC